MCEVALGKFNEVKAPTHNEYMPPGTQSTKALGRIRPDPAGSKIVEKDIEVPMGKKTEFKDGYMGVDEFIVYNTNQIRMRYIVKCQM